MKGSYSIAIFGAFNIKSFGDSLYPIAIYKGLSEEIPLWKVELFSIGGGQGGYDDWSIHTYDEFDEIHSSVGFDAIIVGGGELFHNKDISFEAGKVIYPGGEIWKKPVEYGKRYHLPVILNGVGMPYEFSQSEIGDARSILNGISYVSLRDVYSCERWRHCLGQAGKPVLVPDNMWSVHDFYSNAELEDTFQSLKDEYGIAKKFFLFQYGTTKAFKEVWKLIRKYAENENALIVTIAINA